jgi:hypothetical protein
MGKPDPGEITVAQIAVRKFGDATSYGRFVDDQHCHDIAVAVVEAVEAYRGGREI